MILHRAGAIVPLQVELRKQRAAASLVAQREAEVRAAAQRRASAIAEQLKQAFLMADADARVRQLKEFLARLEQSSSNLSPPYNERIRGWIDVVQKELAAKNPVEDMLQRSLSVPSWSTWPPDWWPTEPNLPSGPETPI